MRIQFNHIHELIVFKNMDIGDVFRCPPVIGDVFLKLHGDMADVGNVVNLTTNRVRTVGEEADCDRLTAVLTVE